MGMSLPFHESKNDHDQHGCWCKVQRIGPVKGDAGRNEGRVQVSVLPVGRYEIPDCKTKTDDTKIE